MEVLPQDAEQRNGERQALAVSMGYSGTREHL